MCALTWLVVDYIMAGLERNAEALLKLYPNIVYLRLGPKLFDPQVSLVNEITNGVQALLLCFEFSVAGTWN